MTLRNSTASQFVYKKTRWTVLAGPGALPSPETGKARLAARLGTSEEALRPRLEALCDRGLLLDLESPSTGQVKYVLAPPWWASSSSR